MYALIRDQTFVHQSGTRRLKLRGGEHASGVQTTGSAAIAESAVTVPKEVEEDQNDPAGQMAAISISHDSDYATAVCIAPFAPLTGDVGGEAAARMYDKPEDDPAYWN